MSAVSNFFLLRPTAADGGGNEGSSVGITFAFGGDAGNGGGGGGEGSVVLDCF
jgi:hypothetical protein